MHQLVGWKAFWSAMTGLPGLRMELHMNDDAKLKPKPSSRRQYDSKAEWRVSHRLCRAAVILYVLINMPAECSSCINPQRESQALLIL
ncbi:hypothetical protein AOLI_G00305250 [Acnodon oligacanthus]